MTTIVYSALLIFLVHLLGLPPYQISKFLTYTNLELWSCLFSSFELI